MAAFQPSDDETHDLGTVNKRWQNVHADKLLISGQANDTSLLTSVIGGHLTVGSINGNQTLDILSHDLNDGGLKLAGVLITASATELNVLDGLTASTAELNILDGLTVSTAELNVLDGLTASTIELNYVDGVTSSIQTQIDTKAPLASPAFTGTATAVNLTLSGNLIVNGLTTTVNSTTVTIDDPIFTLGGDIAAVVDDNKDRGIEFRYFDTEARTGFMGWDDSVSSFTLLKNATNNSEVFSGTAADLIIGALTTSQITLSGNAITADALEINILDGATLTTTELNYVDGVTSSIQTQINSKQNTLTFGISNTNSVKIDSPDVADDEYAKFTSNGLESRSYSEVRTDLGLVIGTNVQAYNADLTTLSSMQVGAASALSLLTSNEIAILDGATLTTTELNYVDGVTSSIQTQIDTKAPLASPTFTGTVAAPTPTLSDNSTKVATTEFVQKSALGISTKTNNYTLELTDAGKLIDFNSSSNLTLTIPANSSVEFPVGTQIVIARYGTGTLTIAITSDTLRSTSSYTKIATQYGAATLVKRTSTEWYLFGDLGA